MTAVRVLRWYWATTSIVAAVLLAALVAGAVFTPLAHRSALYDSVAYGVPALREGRWWTFVTGAFFAPRLLLYLPILALVVVVCSRYERRVGHVRTLVVTLGGQLLAGLVTALFLLPFLDSRWRWAAELGTVRDVGLSAGGFAVLGALTAVLQPLWRSRIRVGFGTYLVAMLLNSGLLWDVEHLVGFVLGVLTGPVLAGRRPVPPQLRFGPRAQRAAVAVIVTVIAVTALVEAVFPGNGGPFHADVAQQHASGITLSLAITSLLLLVAADGLRRGRRVAWVVVTGIMSLALLIVLLAQPSAERTADLVLVGGQLVLLLATVRAFSARAGRRSFRRAGRRLLVVAVLLLTYTAVGFAVLQDDFTPRAQPADVVTEFLSRLFFASSGNIQPATTAARFFVGSIGAVWLVVLVGTAVGLLYSSRRAEPDPQDDARLRELLAQYPSSNIQWMLTWKGISVWTSPNASNAIGYQVVGSVALCLGDPVGPRDTLERTLREFDDYCFRNGWIPCLFAASQACADLAPGLGWKCVEVAEDSIVALPALEFRGKAFQDVRTAINRAGKQEVTLEVTTWAASKPVVTDQLRAISGGWVEDKALPEMGFTLGTLREAADPQVRLHLAVDAERTVEGFTSWMPVGEAGAVIGWTLDLMRRRDEGFRPVMEFLIGASAMTFKEEGYRFLSLSAAPLARAPGNLQDAEDTPVLQKLLDFLGRLLEPYYGFRSLFAFKQKFRPEHYPLYLVFPDSTALAEIAVAIARAYLPTAGLRDWVRIAAQLVLPEKRQGGAG